MSEHLPDVERIARGVEHYRKFGHGHVVPRDDGIKARCGGPGLCKQCALEQIAITAVTTEAPPK